MRSFLLRHRWATMVVVGLMLFATSGATLSRMTCLMGGHSVLSFGFADDCCPGSDAGSNAVLKATCCEFSEATSGAVTFVAHNALALTPVLMVLDAAPVMVMVERSADRCPWLEDRPPPLRVCERLASLGSFLI